MNSKKYDNLMEIPDLKFKRLLTIPIGPFHPALIEPAFLTLHCDGETIKDVNIKVGFSHRSVQYIMEKRNYNRNIFIAERVCGICSNHHATSYTGCVERLLEIESEIPDRARYIRTIILELERLHSHLLWIGIAADLIGFETLFMHSWRDREIIMDLLELISGNRVNYGMQKIGGVRRDIPNELIPKIRRVTSGVRKAIENISSQALSDRIVESRFKNIGVITDKDAQKLGVVGPVARASGLNIDSRKDSPILAYDELDWQICIQKEGDVSARLIVRVQELYESLSIIDQSLDKLHDSSSKEIALENIPSMGSGLEALFKSEPPRGELVYHIITNETSCPERVRIRTPSLINNNAVPSMLKGYSLADAPIIFGSVDPCFSCTDRVIFVKDINKNRTKQLSLRELARKKRKKFRRFIL
ncbi:MAG: nickel-dependent hydrogenase large subunit [Candidatus Hodarchaeota archaeon]